MTGVKRYSKSDAYIDSFKTVTFLCCAVVMSVLMAYVNMRVINPIWLGGSIIVIILYFMINIWFLMQLYEVNRIFIVYALSFVCIGSILSIVSLVTDLRLPTDLPVLSVGYSILSVSPFVAGQIISLDPGAVALSYAFGVGLVAWAASLTINLLDDTRPLVWVKKRFRLQALDLYIDTALDRLGFWISQDSKAWIIAPIFMYVFVIGLVVYGASFI